MTKRRIVANSAAPHIEKARRLCQDLQGLEHDGLQLYQIERAE